MNKFLNRVLITGFIFSVGFVLNATAKERINAYTTVQEDVARELFNAFEKDTGITVDWVRLSTGEAVARLEAEKKNPQASIWVGGVGVGHIGAKNKKLTTPYKTTAAGHIASKYKDPDNYWTGIYAGPLCFISNTKRLKKYDLNAPQSWKELTDKKYQKHVRMANPGSSGTAYGVLATMVQIFGEDKAFDYMGALDKNITLYTRSGSAPGKQAGLGEITIAIGFAHDAVKLINLGYPLKITFPSEGTGYEVASMSLIKNAPKDEVKNAKKLYDWMLGSKAGSILAKSFVAVFAKNVTLAKGAVPISKVKTIDQNDIWSAKNKKRLVEKWNEIVGGGSKTK